MTIEAILFDKDGTLIDEGNKAKSHKLALQQFGVPNGDIWYYAHLGTEGSVISQLQVDEFSLPVSPEDFREIRRNHYKELLKKSPTPIKGTIEFLKNISDEKYLIGLVTQDSREITYDQLQFLGIHTLFHTLVTNEDVLPKYSKPHKAPYELAAKRLYLQPQKCLAIEDTPNGIKSAKSAGMLCVAVRGYHNKDLDLTKADLIVNDLSRYSPDVLISILS